MSSALTVRFRGQERLGMIPLSGNYLTKVTQFLKFKNQKSFIQTEKGGRKALKGKSNKIS